MLPVANETRAGKIGRRWKLRNPRNDRQGPLSAAERTISPNADLLALVTAIIRQAMDDLDAGYDGPYGEIGTANEQYWRAQAYLYFFHGEPTGFERFTAWLGLNARGRYPDHPLFNDAAELRRRRRDLVRLGLPGGLFDRRIAELDELSERGANGIRPIWPATMGS